MKLIQLSMVTGSQPVGGETDDEDEIVISLPRVEETTTPVWIAIDAIRSFNARKPDRNGQPRTGTRIAFLNSAGMAVSETVEQVRDAISAA